MCCKYFPIKFTPITSGTITRTLTKLLLMVLKKNHFLMDLMKATIFREK